MGITIKVSSRVAKGLKNKVKKDVIEAIEGSPALRKEISRVFQMANRRIQNIESAGLFSPAVAALGKGDVKGYSKFSVKGFGNTGSGWQALKREYTKAIAFLNQPTSSATGAREFETQVKQQMNIDDGLWKGVRDAILGNYNSVSSQLLLALPYSDFMQEVYSRAQQSSSSQIEQEAQYLADSLQQNIDETAESIASAYETLINGFKIGL
jgi:hypothetical protein